MIRIALPNKGRLAESARRLLERAGLEFEAHSARALQARLRPGFTALFVRPRDIPVFIADEAADIGISGHDLLAESGRELDTLLPLNFGGCRLVLACRDDSRYRDVAQIPDNVPVATSFPRVTERFFAEAGKTVKIVPVSGAAEIAPHIGVADLIADLVATGSTLKTNGLVEIATILESTAVLLSRPGLANDPQHADPVHDLVEAIASVVRAENKRYLMANVPRDRLEEIRDVLPGVSGPTIVDVLDSGNVVAAHAVIDRQDAYHLIRRLRDLGATGILVTRIERLSP